jgi:adenylate kinase family enzyme
VRLLALIGPPASGKSSLAEALAQEHGHGLFRLRESAWRARPEISGLEEALLHSPDPLGWIDDEYVRAVLDRELGPMLASERPVVLESFPGTANQVNLLLGTMAAARLGPANLRVAELRASDRTLRKRADHRRVCLTCEQDERGDPHRPAKGRRRCRSCGGPLIRRLSDTEAAFERRSRRFNANIPAIGDALATHGVAITPLDATRSIRWNVRAVQRLVDVP